MVYLLSGSGVRTERGVVARQAEPHSGDEAAQLPANLSGRATQIRPDRVAVRPFFVLPSRILNITSIIADAPVAVRRRAVRQLSGQIYARSTNDSRQTTVPAFFVDSLIFLYFPTRPYCVSKNDR